MIHRLGVEAPKKSLVENYMIEIARNYKVQYDPDPSMFLVRCGIISQLASTITHTKLHALSNVLLQDDDDVITSGPSVTAKPFLPDDEPQGGGAGPLPPKEEPRYVHTPQSQPPPPSHQV